MKYKTKTRDMSRLERRWLRTIVRREARQRAIANGLGRRGNPGGTNP